MALKKSSDVQTSSFFKPDEYKNAVALLFEPTAFREAVPTKQYKTGKDITEDRVEARLTVFRTSEQLEKGEPEAVRDVTVNKTALVNVLKELVPNDALAGLVRLKPSANGGNEYWAFVDLDYDTEAKVIAYYERTEAEVPDFLK